jgi:hypothetical protein
MPADVERRPAVLILTVPSWALTALGMYMRAQRQEHLDLRRPDDVAWQSR